MLDKLRSGDEATAEPERPEIDLDADVDLETNRTTRLLSAVVAAVALAALAYAALRLVGDDDPELEPPF